VAALAVHGDQPALHQPGEVRAGGGAPMPADAGELAGRSAPRRPNSAAAWRRGRGREQGGGGGEGGGGRHGARRVAGAPADPLRCRRKVRRAPQSASGLMPSSRTSRVHFSRSARAVRPSAAPSRPRTSRRGSARRRRAGSRIASSGGRVLRRDGAGRPAGRRRRTRFPPRSPAPPRRGAQAGRERRRRGAGDGERPHGAALEVRRGGGGHVHQRVDVAAAEFRVDGPVPR
jgi:hypothetical protein